jgi:hypothetical protein
MSDKTQRLRSNVAGLALAVDDWSTKRRPRKWHSGSDHVRHFLRRLMWEFLVRTVAPA